MWHLFETDPTTHGRFCYECGCVAPWDDFYHLKHGRGGWMSICKPCKSKHRAITRSLEQRYIPPDKCQGCGTATTKLQLDHCHVTFEFRHISAVIVILEHEDGGGDPK